MYRQVSKAVPAHPRSTPEKAHITKKAGSVFPIGVGLARPKTNTKKEGRSEEKGDMRPQP